MYRQISNLISSLKNAQLASKSETYIPLNKYNTRILDILVELGNIRGYSIDPLKGCLVYLKYTDDGVPGIRVLKQISKINKTVDMSAKIVFHIQNTHLVGGYYIISTTKGIITNVEAARLNIGGIPLLLVQ